MSRQSRMLIIVGLFAIIAVVVLALMAQRYSAMLERRTTPEQSRSAD